MNNSAFFDLDQSMSFDLATKKDSVSMTGKGTGKGDGKLIYSIDQNFPTSTSSNFDLSYQIKVENIIMTGRAKTSSTNQTKISAIAK